LLSALVFIELSLRARQFRSRGSYGLCGLALGLVGCFRHDLFVYFALVLALSWALPRAVHRWLGYARPARTEMAWLVGGAAIPLGLVWLPTLVLAGPWAPLRDLVFEQGRHVQPARVLPIPPLTATDPETRWPMFLVRRLEGGVVLACSAPLVAAVLVLGRRWLRVRGSMAAMLVGLLALAVVPQMLVRTDVHHTLFVVTPAVILAAASVEIIGRRLRWLPVKIAVAAGLIWVFTRPVKSDFWPRRSLLTNGMAGTPARRSSHRPGFYEQDEGLAVHRRAVLDFIEAHTAPNERVFFATQNHEWLLVNEVDLYFLANRLPGTRYTQYDPNLETRREVQEEMIASLQQHQVRVVVQSSLIQGHEGQKAMKHGSTLLDDYLRTHFTPVETHGAYTILKRVQ
jgi:hypothetical protein